MRQFYFYLNILIKCVSNVQDQKSAEFVDYVL